MKTKIIPFDLETAKKIQNGKIKGRIRTKDGDFTSRIICFDKVKLVHGDGTTVKQIVSLTYNENAREDVMYVHNQKGEVQAPFGWQRGYDLVLEVPDNEPQFKPFDKVLVRGGCSTAIQDRNIWVPAYYQYHDLPRFVGDDEIYFASGLYWRECIPYEGNQELVGTTDKPKEE